MKTQKIMFPLIALFMLLLASSAFAVFAMDVNGAVAGAGGESGTTENGVICTTDDSNISVSITGATAGNLFRFKVGSTNVTGASLRAFDKGAGDTNADSGYAAADGALTFYIQIPSTHAEGSFDVNAMDVNGGTETAIESIQVKPASTYTEFTVASGSTGWCRITNYSSVSNFTLTDTSSNVVKFTEAVNVSSDIDFDTGVNLTDSSAEITSTASTLQNKAATLTFPNLASASILNSTNDVEVVYNSGDALAADQDCPANKCTSFEIANGTATLNVTGFSKYSLQNKTGSGNNSRLPFDIGNVQSVVGGTTVGVSNAFWIFLLFVLVAVFLWTYFKK